MLALTITCCDEKSNHQADNGTGKSLVIYKQSSNDVRKGYFVEVAQTRETMAKGLMGRRSLDKDAGFMFDVNLVPKDMDVAMWMKDTLIPLDMLFIDESGVVYYIYENAEPYSTKAIMAPQRPRAVLEINGGQVKEYGIEVGDKIRNELFGNM